MSAKPQTETLDFDAQVSELLHLVTHSLYSNKEIFLRELISNASDAADKLRYQALSDEALFENEPDLKIWVDFDKDNRTVTVRDNGIGMTREEVIANLGTIAQSGTRAFKDILSADETKDSQLIGQFGVGFYSAFVVADKVVVRTRHAGMNSDQGVMWESEGTGKYTIQNVDKTTRGTEIVLYIKKEQEEFLSEYRLREIIAKYSDHIALPILMLQQQAPSTAEDKEKEQAEEKPPEYEAVNRAKALWALPKSEIDEKDYQELYKHIAHDFENPLTWAHNKVEGKLEYTSLLYVPARAPFDLYQRDMQRGLKLYVKRVFVMDDAEQLMPLYLRFVKGIVDSGDLPLNVSREILQSNQVINKIRTACVKRVLGLLEKMAANDAENYQIFWKEFGQVLKEGPAEDFANKDRIAKLLRFASTQTGSEEQTVSLEDYIKRMPEDQDKIYYLAADNFNAANNSPLLEIFRQKNIEVLLLSDRVDEWLVSHLTDFEGKAWQSIAKGKVDIGDKNETETEKEDQEKLEKDFTPVTEKIKSVLGERVQEVRVTSRLTDSPACVVFGESDMSGNMARMLSAAGQAVPVSAPIFEINPKHAILARLKTEQDSAQLGDWVEVLFAQALLAEGEELPDAATFVKRLNKLLMHAD